MVIKPLTTYEGAQATGPSKEPLPSGQRPSSRVGGEIVKAQGGGASEVGGRDDRVGRGRRSKHERDPNGNNLLRYLFFYY
jgi:hypothetical protein